MSSLVMNKSNTLKSISLPIQGFTSLVYFFSSGKSRLVRTRAHSGCEGIHTKGNLREFYIPYQELQHLIYLYFDLNLTFVNGYLFLCFPTFTTMPLCNPEWAGTWWLQLSGVSYTPQSPTCLCCSNAFRSIGANLLNDK